MRSVTSTHSTDGLAQHTIVKHHCAAAGQGHSMSAETSVGYHGMAEESKPCTDLYGRIASNGDMHIPSTIVKLKKSVRWATITVHEFGVGLGGSAVSNKGGPSIGLADIPEFTWTTRVGEMAECVEGVHRFTPTQRIRLLQAAGIPDGIITRHARETDIILGSRRRSKTSGKDGKLDEEDEKIDKICSRLPRKRDAEQAMLEHPTSVFLRRPRMIPVNYV